MQIIWRKRTWLDLDLMMCYCLNSVLSWLLSETHPIKRADSPGTLPSRVQCCWVVTQVLYWSLCTGISQWETRDRGTQHMKEMFIAECIWIQIVSVGVYCFKWVSSPRWSLNNMLVQPVSFVACPGCWNHWRRFLQLTPSSPVCTCPNWRRSRTRRIRGIYSRVVCRMLGNTGSVSSTMIIRYTYMLGRFTGNHEIVLVFSFQVLCEKRQVNK